LKGAHEENPIQPNTQDQTLPGHPLFFIIELFFSHTIFTYLEKGIEWYPEKEDISDILN
jgi:hypothetical protein